MVKGLCEVLKTNNSVSSRNDMTERRNRHPCLRQAGLPLLLNETFIF
jgi:hypothetical protein